MIRALVSCALLVIVLGGTFVIGGLRTFVDDCDFGIDDDE